MQIITYCGLPELDGRLPIIGAEDVLSWNFHSLQTLAGFYRMAPFNRRRYASLMSTSINYLSLHQKNIEIFVTILPFRSNQYSEHKFYAWLKQQTRK